MEEMEEQIFAADFGCGEIFELDCSELRRNQINFMSKYFVEGAEGR